MPCELEDGEDKGELAEQELSEQESVEEEWCSVGDIMSMTEFEFSDSSPRLASVGFLLMVKSVDMLLASPSG